MFLSKKSKICTMMAGRIIIKVNMLSAADSLNIETTVEYRLRHLESKLLRC